MFILTKKSILALFIAILPILSIYSENKNQTSPEASWDTVLTTIKSSCKNLSEKCEHLYNPLSILAVTTTAAALGLKNIMFLVAGGIAVAYSGPITEYVKGYTESFEKPASTSAKSTENRESHIQA